MKQLYYTLNEYIKSYHIFKKSAPSMAAEYLKRINETRLHIAILAQERQIFIEQLLVKANASGYKNDVFFTHDDINSLISKFIAFLKQDTTLTLTQQGTREILFTRQAIAWQQLASQTQDTTNVGQKIPFDLLQEIYLEKSQTLDFGVTNQTTDDGFIFVHGCNLKNDPLSDIQFLKDEIEAKDFFGNPCIPEPVLVPIQFIFPSATIDSKATAVDGGPDIFSIKNDRSVILTEVSTTSLNSRITLLDRGRDQEICNEVESLGIAGDYRNQYTVYYPLPYPHLLMAQDRLQLRALNGSDITASQEPADADQVICFRGFTI